MDKLASTLDPNPTPVIISDDTNNHTVTMFNSPDHSIKPVTDFIMSANKSIDLYIPEMISWTYGTNLPIVPQLWLKEGNPIFQALANVGVLKKTVVVRVVTNGPQVPFVPLMANMWEWITLQNAQVHFAMHIKIGGILIMVDGGEKVLLTSMDGSKDSFLINRESSIIMEKPNDQVVDLFKKTFDQDFMKSLPFLPNKETILNSTNPPMIDPVAITLIQTHQFPDISIPQPPPALLESPLRPYIAPIVEVNDAAYVLAMAGPKLVEVRLTYALSSSSFLQVGIPSLPYTPLADTILSTARRVNSAGVYLSYYLDSKSEADESNNNLKKLQTSGMFASLYLGPLYNAKPATKDYYKRSGRALINSSDDGGTVYFMTGGFTDDDVNVKRNFYVGFQSEKTSLAVNKLVSGDQLKSTHWNLGTQQKVEKKPDEE